MSFDQSHRWLNDCENSDRFAGKCLACVPNRLAGIWCHGMMVGAMNDDRDNTFYWGDWRLGWSGRVGLGWVGLVAGQIDSETALTKPRWFIVTLANP